MSVTDENLTGYHLRGIREDVTEILRRVGGLEDRSNNLQKGVSDAIGNLVQRANAIDERLDATNQRLDRFQSEVRNQFSEVTHTLREVRDQQQAMSDKLDRLLEK